MKTTEFIGAAERQLHELAGRMKPGELQSGGYGFYYKGQQQSYSPQQEKFSVKDLRAVKQPATQKLTQSSLKRSA